MTRIVAIVEGDGEVKALPILLRRLASEWANDYIHVDIPPPIRVKRDRFLNKAAEFERHLTLAASKSGPHDWILVLLDADDDCPAKLGKQILERAQRHVPHRQVSAVLANREYEAWFLAAAQSLNGVHGFAIPVDEIVDAEKPRNAKRWMEKHIHDEVYDEVKDQPAFTAHFNLQQAFDNSRSFRKLCTEWAQHVRKTP
ncbi:MAG: DUF4276 family protein [Lautropia sp.]|nr:DUF4276 family protein [Lautropia sp.]